MIKIIPFQKTQKKRRQRPTMLQRLIELERKKKQRLLQFIEISELIILRKMMYIGELKQCLKNLPGQQKLEWEQLMAKQWQESQSYLQKWTPYLPHLKRFLWKQTSREMEQWYKNKQQKMLSCHWLQRTQMFQELQNRQQDLRVYRRRHW